MTQVTGRDRPLLGGVVTADDADAASLFDMARNILGNPYAPATASGDDGSDTAGRERGGRGSGGR